MHITRHADVRMNQRGVTNKQLTLVLEHGDPYGDEIVLSPKAARGRIDKTKGDSRQLDAVVGRVASRSR